MDVFILVKYRMDKEGAGGVHFRVKRFFTEVHSYFLAIGNVKWHLIFLVLLKKLDYEKKNNKIAKPK